MSKTYVIIYVGVDENTYTYGPFSTKKEARRTLVRIRGELNQARAEVDDDCGKYELDGDSLAPDEYISDDGAMREVSIVRLAKWAGIPE